ncbi:hypothetical protein J2X85_001596 [Microbacterium trichothecenolyticum]|uniref:hypothetical protein n=1 Tax=Microbacterium trichothecenolyticum TaxID=69370 RepID=UPI002859D32D|nr:hypothetical protein [Microbacterium trichothecenolyticum]MDR7184573.1 hypothetical protein [Microbacterium trichothecenolyticum]
MPSTLTSTPQGVADENIDLPPRRDVLQAMLGGTGRGGVPVRSVFVQLKEPNEHDSRHGRLSQFTTDARALDAYLLIHALASSKAPHAASYPALVWAHAAGLDRDATLKSARQRWSKAVAKLSKLNLIEASRDGRQSVYTLLHESGSGEPYTRPKNLTEGGWVTIPYAYWLEGYDEQLSLPEKLMLLVSLDQKQRFELPTARTQEWYGIPETTASRGFRGLMKREILEATKRTTIDLQNGKSLMRTVNVYTTAGIWTRENRKRGMTVARKKVPRGTKVKEATA